MMCLLVDRRFRLGPGDIKNSDLAALTRGPKASSLKGTALHPIGRPSSMDSKRRFTFAVLMGLVAVAPAYLWVLFDLWNDSPSLLRTSQLNGYASNFYDLQARAMLHGHLYIANGALGSEAFVHGGRQFTLFGLFPSLLRMPVLMVTHSLDGRLTAMSMLLAWLTTALFISVLAWRVRVLVTGPADLGRIEAASYGVLVATILGGSVLMYLASNPYVFSEDVAWSVALAVGSMFALLGVLERPSWGRILGAGALILAANLNRATTGYACAIGAALVAVWFAFGRGGSDSRWWALPVFASGIVPLAVGCAISYAKFGILFGFPISEQIVYQTFGLSRNGSDFGLQFLPSNLLAYFQPLGVHLTAVFPFITQPPGPARGVGGIVLDGRDRVASVVSSMPFLFLAGLWGVVATFTPRPAGRSNLLRIILIATAAAASTVMIFGWIFNRYLADLLPFFIVASTIGTVDVWRRLKAGRRLVRFTALGIMTVLGVFGIAANIGIAITPQGEWTSVQVIHYVQVQQSLSNLTGHPLNANVVRGNALPTYAPADQLYIVGNCASLYISDGWGASGIRGFFLDAVDLQTQWKPVELGPSIRHVLDITFHGPIVKGRSVPLVTVGNRSPSTVYLQSYGKGEVRFSVEGPLGTVVSAPSPVHDSRTYRLTVTTDPNVHLVAIAIDQTEVLSATLYSQGTARVHAYSTIGSTTLPITVANATGSGSNMSLCRSLR
jgi:hypothetical protein